MSGIMNGYVLIVLGVVLVSTVTTAILPDGKTSVFVKSISRLACVFVVVSPVFTFFQKGINRENIFEETVINTDGAYIDYCSKISVENAEKVLKNTIEQEFDVVCDVCLVWRYDKETTDGLNGFFLISYEGERVKITEIQIRFIEEITESMKNEIINRIQTDTGCKVVIGANGKS